MPSVNSANKNYELMQTGENQGTWGIKTNANLSTVDLNFGGRISVNVGGNSNITIATSQAQNVYHTLTGTLTGSIAYIVPTQGSFYAIKNSTSGAFTITVRMASGSGVAVPQGFTAFVFADPTAGAVVPMFTAPGAALDMGQNQVGNLPAPSAANDAARKAYVDSAISTVTALLDAFVPLGTVLPYAGPATVPAGGKYVFPYGQAISRTTYSAYFAIVGTTYGVGDGSTTFNVPDLRGRAVFGLDNMGGTAANRITTAGSSINGTTVGAAGGAQNVTLTTTEMPSHNHGGVTSTIGDHTHGYSRPTTTIFQGGSGGAFIPSISSGTTDPGGSHSHTISAQGGGGAHQNMPPAIVMPVILRVL
ncbi:phage tail protein [Ancylobacter sp.]|uniref:phage tail protein n=1 Tax=Ancylobacter sp. TaxID=1872567 RepID=UPI003BAA02B2